MILAYDRIPPVTHDAETIDGKLGGPPAHAADKICFDHISYHIIAQHMARYDMILSDIIRYDIEV